MKKTLKKITSLISVVFLSAAMASCGGGQTSESESDVVAADITYATYGSYWFPQHDYKTMPVAAYNATPPAKDGYKVNFLTDERIFREYEEAGINTTMGLTDFIGSNLNDVETALNYCYDYDLAYLLAYGGAYNVKSESAVKSALAKIMYHDSFAGIMQSDEPGRTMFENIASSRTIFENVLKDTSAKLYHVNLFPTYASEKQLWFRTFSAQDALPVDSYTYGQYLSDYMEICKPQILSYDFYPIAGEFPTLMNGYFENMSVIRKAALKANIPFWTYIQTCSFGNGRISTEADLLWNVNTCLAYGAKGIQYFCGVNPQGDFSGSVFDRDGNKTEMYDIVKKADSMIAAVDEYLMCGKSKGIIIKGVMPQISGGSSRMTAPDSDIIKSGSFNELQSVEANHTMIGCFDYNGKTALYVVNNAIADDTEAGYTAAENVKLDFNKNVSGFTLNAAAKTQFGGNSVSFSLGAGEAVLVVLN